MKIRQLFAKLFLSGDLPLAFRLQERKFLRPRRRIMFIVSLNYTAPLDRIDSLLDEHVVFLKAKYAEGILIASGRKIPRTGGVLLARACDQKTLEKHLAEDPFHREGVATYDITEFTPSMTAPGFEAMRD